jgi:murein DD-endopeptidase MepM/ murein hydrolase activator NlpD
MRLYQDVMRIPLSPVRGACLRRRLFALGLAVVAAGCGVEEAIREAMTPTPTPHEAYALQLRGAGLEGTALGREWMQAAERALHSPVAVALPFRETGYWAPEEASSVGFRMPLRRGQKLTLELDVADTAGSRVFVDLYRDPADSTEPLDHVASGDTTSRTLEYEARRDGDYILRLQPELLRGGRYTLTVRAGASLAFPVPGRDTRAIRSSFGADRDGGRRSHHGVDIFAPRGTPVVAVAPGRVRRVEETNIGGKVVWVDTRSSHRVYYAHLDRQIAYPGQEVEIGDTLGFIGNTGNARTTPPHLHFGIYQRGPVDPFPFVHQPATAIARLTASTEHLGSWLRTTAPTATLRSSPRANGETVAELPRHTVVRIDGASGGWYRARLPDGSTGWLAAASAEPARRPVRTELRSAAAVVQQGPVAEAPPVESVAPGTQVPVLGRFADYLFVQTPAGRTGWLAADGGR